MPFNNRDYTLAPRMGDCKMITTKLINPRGDGAKRNPEPTKDLEVEEVKLFGDNDHQSVRIGKIILNKC